MNEYRSELESIEPHVTINANMVGALNDEKNRKTVFTVGDSGLTSDVSHRFGDYKAGFDLTDFKTITPFVRVLENLNLHPVEEYFRLSFVHDGSNDRYVYLWANSEGMVVTGNNPITGAYSRPEHRNDEVGYASYIGIEGKSAFVEKAKSAIKDNGNYKDISPTRRDFI